jgi:hypothetical protein
MPVVFVHGVNTRKEEAYDREAYDKAVRERNDQLRTTTLAPATGTPYAGTIIDAYWGDLGAPVEARKMRSLPGGTRVPLGSPAEEVVDPEALAALGDEFLAELAAESPVDAVDLLVTGVLAHRELLGLEAPDELLRFAGRAAARADRLERQRQPIEVTTNDEFIVALIGLVAAAEQPGTAVALGPTDLVGELQSGVAHLLGLARSGATAAGRAARSAAGAAVGGTRRLASRALLAWKREAVSREAALFLGDVFVYLMGRGTPASPGEIPARIGQHLAEGQRARAAGDPLIVIGHSLGGVILYDILSGFQPGARPLVPGLEIDVLVTVGSQVGVFAELGRYLVQGGGTGPGRAGGLSRPACVGRWLNIYDRIDAFSFQAAGVFAGVEDYDFSSRTGIISAHGAYFRRASFYERLGARLRERPAP